ncbi:TetR/AcrR family transcriptional regulator [Natrialbaceae archaeon GCM10025810]|uniref:TetR/AcrR family transcriptional regulator n=1 Tax=Halovalidus salilacus TaxID=3075124 RepID=UPI0036230821
MTDTTVRREIMTATFEALSEHGYAELTAQDIADRTGKSKSLLFYHYGSKEDLVAEFVEDFLERFDERVEETRSLAPVERLATFVDWFLTDPSDGHDDREAFHVAMLELRVQAVHNDRFRELLGESDDRLREALEEILAAGIEEGQFVEHDPEALVPLLIAAFDGARIRQVTTGRDEYLSEVRRGIVEDLVDDVLADGVEFPPPGILEGVADGDRANDEDGSQDGDSTDEGVTDDSA